MGQKIKKDFVLAEIDKREFENTLKESESTLVSLTARLQDAELNFKRTQKLYQQGASTKQQFDTSFTNFTDLKAQYEKAKTQVVQAQLNLEYTEIKAPEDGIIAKSSVEVGQFANVGEPLFGYVESKDKWVIANFKETEIEYLSPGNIVTISVDAYPNKEYLGKIYALSSATGASFTLLPPDNATGNFTKIVQRVPVRIHFENLTSEEIEKLKAGLSVFVKIKKHQK